MKIIKDIRNFNSPCSVVTVGAFDGVHCGHKQIIYTLKQTAEKYNGDAILFTFDPHPRLVVNTKPNIQLLNTPKEKIELLKNENLDYIIQYPFTKEFSNLSFTDFVRNILIKKLHICYIIFGYDHHFGHNREGDYYKLKQIASTYNFKVIRVRALQEDGIKISSTKIRNLLLNGDILTANKYLGYNYFLSGKVVKGNGIGTKIGFPTANIDISDKNKLIPCNGVYVVRVVINKKVYYGMMNIGIRPTISNLEKRILEVHIFNFSQSIYRKGIRVYILERIRDEKKFSTLNKLVEQIKKDELLVRKLLKKYI